MNLNLQPPSPLEYFATLVGSDDDLPLLEAATSLALDEYPELDVQHTLAEVDQLIERLRRRLPADAASLHRLWVLNQFFFRELGFGGNVNHFHDPDNSYPHKLLQTRRGIPVSLAVLWLEMARGVGLVAYGVNFPRRFLVKVGVSAGLVVIDPLTGESLSREALDERLQDERQSAFEEEGFDAPLDLYLMPATPRDILARMLRNLKDIHQTAEDWPALRAVLDRLVVLQPEAWEHRRDRGLVLAETGQLGAAVQDLELYLARAGRSIDRKAIAERVVQLREALRG